MHSEAKRRLNWQSTLAAAAFGLAVAALPVAAAEEAPPQLAQLKVAVVNTGGAIEQSEEAKVFMDQLRLELEPDQNELQELQQQIADLRQRAVDEADVMSVDEQRELAKDIEGKQLDLEYGAQKLQKKVQDRQQELIQVMGPKVEAVVNDLVEVERYDMVFERSNVGYVNPRHDVTAKVTEKLNERYEPEN